MKIYRGWRDKTGAHVERLIDYRDPQPLPLYLDVENHSPTGFEWGYGGSGPAQLALAILIDTFGNKARAAKLHQPFKFAVVAQLDRDEWELDEMMIRLTAEKLESELWGRANISSSTPRTTRA